MTAAAIVMVEPIAGSGFPAGWTGSSDADPTKICGWTEDSESLVRMSSLMW